MSGRVAAPFPAFATAAVAARYLDMKLSEFQGLVARGLLPGPRRLGSLDRWDMEEVARIIRGDAVDGMRGRSMVTKKRFLWRHPSGRVYVRLKRAICTGSLRWRAPPPSIFNIGKS